MPSDRAESLRAKAEAESLRAKAAILRGKLPRWKGELALAKKKSKRMGLKLKGAEEFYEERIAIMDNLFEDKEIKLPKAHEALEFEDDTDEEVAFYERGVGPGFFTQSQIETIGRARRAKELRDRLKEQKEGIDKNIKFLDGEILHAENFLKG